MYFRSKVTKTGRAIQLVESYRDLEGKPRQKVILSLGDADLAKNLWHDVAEAIEAHFKEVLLLFPPSPEVAGWAGKIIREMEKKGWTPTRKPDAVTVHLDKITHHDTTELGPELVALNAWECLGFAEVLKDIGFNKRQQIDAALSIINRLIDPCSEHALPSWVRTTSFEDLLGHSLRNSTSDRFYRIADLLLEHKERIEQALNTKEQELFGLQRSILLYDLTNTYFEGQSFNNPKAQRGCSKEKRRDAPLLSVGLVLDGEGFALRHEVFSGNTHDSQTLMSMIEKLHRQGEPTPMIILDSGFASQENLQQLRQQQIDYIVVGKRQTRLAYEEHFQTQTFKEVQGRDGKPPVQVATIEEQDEKIILCKSEARSAKESQMLSQAEEKYLQALNKLKQRIEKGRLKKTEAIQKSLGKLHERHPRIARYYDIQLTTSNQLTWERLDAQYQSAQQLTGSYYLRSSRKNLDDQTIWNLYINLTRVEAGFRALKSNLGLRPVFHQREDRCDSHILITVLAYRLLHYIEYILHTNGINNSWVTIKRLLQTHCYTTIACPSLQGSTYHIRTPGVPDADQSHLYQLFGIELSKLPRRYVTV
jgi:transposase